MMAAIDEGFYTPDLAGSGQFGTCVECKKPPTPEGHDGCLGTLPGVMNACCGHGKNELAYVQYPPGDYVVRGVEAAAHIQDLKALRGD